MTLPTWMLAGLSWVVAAGFAVSLIADAGFPFHASLSIGDGTFLVLALLFLFLPFFSKVKLGKVLELEREVQRASDELRDFKSDVRATLSVLSTNINTIGGLTNQVTVNIPGLAELREARDSVEVRVSNEERNTAADIEESVLVESEDTTLALAKMRIDMERLLRKILQRRLSVGPNDVDMKFAGINQLFARFLRNHKDFEYLTSPFKAVVQVCNAAIHAQHVTPEQAREALSIGAKIIAVLQNAADET